MYIQINFKRKQLIQLFDAAEQRYSIRSMEQWVPDWDDQIKSAQEGMSRKHNHMRLCTLIQSYLCKRSKIGLVKNWTNRWWEVLRSLHFNLLLLTFKFVCSTNFPLGVFGAANSIALAREQRRVDTKNWTHFILFDYCFVN